MNKIFFIILTGMIIVSGWQQASAQNNNGGNWQKILHIKFKTGKSTEGMEIGKNYYSKAYAMAGYPTEVFEYEKTDGEWDAIIVIPLKGGLSEFDVPHPDIVIEKLIQLTGGEEALNELNERFFSCIDHQRMDLLKLERF